MKSIIFTLSSVWDSFKYLIKSEYKWLLIIFLLWLYRIDFISDTGEGIGKPIQIVSISIILLLLIKYDRNLWGYAFSHTNFCIKSCILLYVFALLSSLWSILPFFSGYLAVQNIILILAFVWLFSNFETFEDKESAFLMFAIGTNIFEFIGIRIITDGGLFQHHLSSGSVAAMITAYCGSELARKNNFKISENRASLLLGSFLISAIIVILSTSSGANASALFGLAVGLLFSKKGIWAFVLFSIAILLFTYKDQIDQIILFLNPGKTIEMIRTGTGRQFIWEQLINAYHDRPFLGYGFACVERYVSSFIIHANIVDAHNSYIGILGSLGIIGTIIFGIHILSVIKKLLSNRNMLGYLGLLSAISCALLNAYSYGYLSGKGNSITYMYFILVILTFYYEDERQTYEYTS